MAHCCFTGHRHIPPAVIPALRKRIDETLYALIDEGIYRFRAGGAMGFDRYAAEQVLAMRNRFGFIRLDLILPCHNQTRGWPAEESAAYRRILADADSAVFLEERYSAGCMQRRNLQLLAPCDICVCYLTHLSGGTAFTVARARDAGMRVINLGEPAVKKAAVQEK